MVPCIVTLIGGCICLCQGKPLQATSYDVATLHEFEKATRYCDPHFRAPFHRVDLRMERLVNLQR
jgi:hypothetical protein